MFSGEVSSRKVVQEKALAAIEGLVLLQDPECNLLATIYRFAHVGLGECGNAHEDWARELEATHEKLVESGIL